MHMKLALCEYAIIIIIIIQCESISNQMMQFLVSKTCLLPNQTFSSSVISKNYALELRVFWVSSSESVVMFLK